eukprot:1503569-Rhodomonas_salina.1
MLTDGDGWASCGLVTSNSIRYVVLASSTRPRHSDSVSVRSLPSPLHRPSSASPTRQTEVSIAPPAAATRIGSASHRLLADPSPVIEMAMGLTDTASAWDRISTGLRKPSWSVLGLGGLEATGHV